MNFHLMQYDLVTGSGATAGDLSNGVVLAQTGSNASSLSPVDTDNDRMSNGDLTINTANVDSGKICVAFFENVGGVHDCTVNMTIKYNLR